MDLERELKRLSSLFAVWKDCQALIEHQQTVELAVSDAIRELGTNTMGDTINTDMNESFHQLLTVRQSLFEAIDKTLTKINAQWPVNFGRSLLLRVQPEWPGDINDVSTVDIVFDAKSEPHKVFINGKTHTVIKSETR